MVTQLLRTLFLVLLLTGCVSTPTLQELESQYYGPYPENYQEIIQEYMEPGLNSPLARIEFLHEPVRSYFYSGLPYKKEYGWVVCANVKDEPTTADRWIEFSTFFMWPGLTEREQMNLFIVRDGEVAFHPDLSTDIAGRMMCDRSLKHALPGGKHKK